MADLSDDDLARIWAKLDPDRWPITASGPALARAAIEEDRALNAQQAAPTWSEADTVALAHRAGFAGTSWSMGPEELAHLLNLAAAPLPKPAPGFYTHFLRNGVLKPFTGTHAMQRRTSLPMPKADAEALIDEWNAMSLIMHADLNYSLP